MSPHSALGLHLRRFDLESRAFPEIGQVVNDYLSAGSDVKMAKGRLVPFVPRAERYI